MQLNFNTKAEQLQTHGGILLSTPGLPAIHVEAVRKQRLKCEQNDVTVRLPVKTFKSILDKASKQELSQIPTLFEEVVPGDLSPDRISASTDKNGAIRLTDLRSKLKNTVVITPDQLQHVNKKIVQPFEGLRSAAERNVSEIA